MRLSKGCKYSCDFSEHGPQRSDEVVPQASGDRPGGDRLLRDRLRMGKIFLLTLPHSAGQNGIVEQDVVLIVELETVLERSIVGPEPIELGVVGVEELSAVAAASAAA